jgi:hypothetical protein
MVPLDYTDAISDPEAWLLPTERRRVVAELGDVCGSEIAERPRVTYARDDWARSWAWNLKARHEAGERLTPAQIDAYTAALRAKREEVSDATV